LPAECVLFYSAADVIRWQGLIERSAEEKAAPPEVAESGKQLLEEVRRFATVVRCRHAALSAYFGETYQNANCGACDFCLGEVEGVADSTVLAQKVLSCIARVEQRFGVEHVVDVLGGASSERVLRLGHEKLSTYGLLKELPRKTVTNLIYQLVDAGLLERTPGDRPVLKLNAQSWEVMRGGRGVTLLQAKESKSKRTRIEEASWDNVDEPLFDNLRKLRREIAGERKVPAYVILHDAALRELASVKPGSVEELRHIRGMGERKLADFGDRLLQCIKSHIKTAGEVSGT
jgi:ATP-dependent DNA helicase RecQ